jgi:two-component system OmpR family response regulator
MRILLIEDDARLADYIRKGLQEAGHTVLATGDGREGLFLATGEEVDALVLDRMLPGLDGLDLLRMLRAAGRATPVLVLSSLADVEQRVAGLREGADDYLVKPFAFAELLARLEALLRRPGAVPREQTRLVVADLEMDLLRRTVQRGGQAVDLQPREFKLLEYLMRHADQVVTRTMLLEAVWDYHFDPQTNVIDVHISRLRQKIDRDHAVPLLHTVRGAGYRLGLA